MGAAAYMQRKHTVGPSIGLPTTIEKHFPHHPLLAIQFEQFDCPGTSPNFHPMRVVAVLASLIAPNLPLPLASPLRTPDSSI